MLPVAAINSTISCKNFWGRKGNWFETFTKN